MQPKRGWYNNDMKGKTTSARPRVRNRVAQSAWDRQSGPHGKTRKADRRAEKMADRRALRERLDD